MEEYRKKLKKRFVLYLLVLIVSLAGIGIFFVFGRVLFGMDVELRRSFGGIFGILFLASFAGILSSTVMLGDENKLKKEYIRSTDERNLVIEARSSNVTLNIVMAGLYIGFVIITLFSDNGAGKVLGICCYSTLLIKRIVKSYYNKKM